MSRIDLTTHLFLLQKNPYLAGMKLVFKKVENQAKNPYLAGCSNGNLQA